MIFQKKKIYRFFSKALALNILVSFVCLSIGPVSIQNAYSQIILNLPEPGTMVPLTQSFHPLIIKGVNISLDDPLKLNFIIDKGSTDIKDEALQTESMKLIKYFLASLTVPEQEMWVNLSPYEKDRIVPKQFGKTLMGRDLLAQDYMLKQLTASLMHPEDELGRDFWKRVYQKAYEKYGTTEIPMNTFNKIWIVPDKAVIYEHEKGAFIVESKLRVLLEEDYLALEVNQNNQKHGLGDMTKDDLPVISGVPSEVIREILIPEIEKEVNEGKIFANLRQIYNSMILASWYKQNLKESLLGQVYVNKQKIDGVDVEDVNINEKIYNQYVKAFEKGVFDLIKEDYDETIHAVIPRKYFSGGVGLDFQTADRSLETSRGEDVLREARSVKDGVEIEVKLRRCPGRIRNDVPVGSFPVLEEARNDTAMLVEDETGYALQDLEVSVNEQGLLDGFYQYEGDDKKHELTALKQRPLEKDSDELKAALNRLENFIFSSRMFETEGNQLVSLIESFEDYFRGDIVVIDDQGDLSLKLSSDKLLVLSERHLDDPLHFLHSILLTSSIAGYLTVNTPRNDRDLPFVKKREQYFIHHVFQREVPLKEKNDQQIRRFWAVHALLYQIFPDELRRLQSDLKGQDFDPNTKREFDPVIALFEIERILMLGEPLTVELSVDNENEERKLPLAFEPLVQIGSGAIRLDVFPFSDDINSQEYQEGMKNFPELAPIASAKDRPMEYPTDDGQIFYPHQGSLGMTVMSIESSEGRAAPYGLIQENQFAWEIRDIKSAAIRKRVRKFLNAVHRRFAEILNDYYGIDTYAIPIDIAEYLINGGGLRKKVDPRHLVPAYTTPYQSEHWTADVLIPPGKFLEWYLHGEDVRGYKFQPSSVASPVKNRNPENTAKGKEPGGIDFNPEMLNMSVKRNGAGIRFLAPQDPVQNYDVSGFLPVIIDITPVTDIPELIGLKHERKEMELIDKE